MSEHKNPVEQAVDLVIYAPIGFAIEARKLLPTFVERGRQQVQMAKAVGQFASNAGQQEAGRRLGRFQHQAGTVLNELGLGALTGAQAPEPTIDAQPGTPSPPPAGSVTAQPRSSAGAADLPIADYDSLAASQVIPRLAGLDPAELEAVRAYEVAHRGRKTILGKVAQLNDV